MFLSIRTKFRHIVASEELRVILEFARSARLGIGESVWEDFKEALSETGVLHGFGSDLRTVREARYENRSRRFIGAVSELAPRVECMSRMIRTKVVKLG